MQYIVIAYDRKGNKTYKRRLSARKKHIELGNAMKIKGKLLFAAALLNKNKKMCGSIMIFNFQNKKELTNCLKIEPYVTGKVWGKIEIKICKTGPSFSKKQYP